MDYDIEFRDVSFKYQDSDKHSLRNINLRAARGEIILITGPAGSGKTTLCSCINGLIPHFHDGELSGEVFVRGYNTRRARIGGIASLVATVFQDPESQLVTASVVDEIAFGPENMGVSREDINQRVAEALRATRLVGYEDREPHNLSGGEQQACVIAAVYAMHPEIYVMDEPTANLDPEGRKQILSLIVDVAKRRGKTLVLVEHALEEVLPLVDRIIVVHDGEIVRDGPVDQVLAAGDIPRVFIRPPVVQIADQIGLHPLPLDPASFSSALFARYDFKPILPGQFDKQISKPSGPSVIEIQDVTFSYDKQRPALDGVSLTIHQGELVAILGRNGSGKTTLIRHIIGLQQPDRGSVRVLGKDVATTPTHELAQDVGFCFQNPNHQIVSFRVRDEMAFGLKAHNADPAEFASRIAEALEFVDMLDYLDAEIFDLGKGQKQRLALASVLTLRPQILIIDEPTTGQDPQMTQEIFEIIKRLNDAGTTVVMITHRIDYAAAYAERVIVMQHGRVAFDGPAHELLQNQDLMQANSLDLPQTTRLAVELSPYGVPPWLVTVEQLEQAVRSLVEDANGR